MKTPKTRDPLGPLDAITGILAGILLTLLAVGGIALAVGDDWSLLGVGADDACVTSHRGYATIQSLEDDPVSRHDDGLKRHVSVSPDSANVCDRQPSAWGHALFILTQSPTFLVFLGFILLARRIITYAQKNGLFSQPLAERIERLGWLLLFGLVGSALVEWIAEGMLLSTMTTTASWSSGSFSVSVPGIIGAYGLVSIGRVMNRAAALQADADATI